MTRKEAMHECLGMLDALHGSRVPKETEIMYRILCKILVILKDIDEELNNVD